jgi:hypothetical protein
MTPKDYGYSVVFALQILIVKPLRDRARQREMEAGKLFRFGDFAITCEPLEESRVLVGRVAEALGLVHEVNPLLFGRIRREIPRFYIRRGAGAAYWSRLSTCVLEASQVAAGPAHETALKIVHEAAHAHISHCGIPWNPKYFDRTEKRCIKEEIAFCRRLVQLGYAVSDRIEWYRVRLERPIYTRQAMQLRRIRERAARSQQ